MMAGKRFENDIGISMPKAWKLRTDGRKRDQKGYYALTVNRRDDSVLVGARCGYDLHELRTVLDEISGEIEFSEYSVNLSKL